MKSGRGGGTAGRCGPFAGGWLRKREGGPLWRRELGASALTTLRGFVSVFRRSAPRDLSLAIIILCSEERVPRLPQAGENTPSKKEARSRRCVDAGRKLGCHRVGEPGCAWILSRPRSSPGEWTAFAACPDHSLERCMDALDLILDGDLLGDDNDLVNFLLDSADDNEEEVRSNERAEGCQSIRPGSRVCRCLPGVQDDFLQGFLTGTSHTTSSDSGENVGDTHALHPRNTARPHVLPGPTATGCCLHAEEHGDNCTICAEAPNPEDAALYELCGEKGEPGRCTPRTWSVGHRPHLVACGFSAPRNPNRQEERRQDHPLAHQAHAPVGRRRPPRRHRRGGPLRGRPPRCRRPRHQERPAAPQGGHLLARPPVGAPLKHLAPPQLRRRAPRRLLRQRRLPRRRPQARPPRRPRPVLLLLRRRHLPRRHRQSRPPRRPRRRRLRPPHQPPRRSPSAPARRGAPAARPAPPSHVRAAERPPDHLQHPRQEPRAHAGAGPAAPRA